jgi:hypothetical protein
MTPEQLARELDRSLVRPDIVLGSLEQRRRRRTRRRRLALGSTVVGLAAAAVAVGALAGFGHLANTPQAGAGSGCDDLLHGLTRSLQAGSSLVEAKGNLTGRTGTDDQTPFVQMRLTQVEVLSGAAVPRSAEGWLQTTPERTSGASDAPGLWAQDGSLIAVYTPAHVAKRTLGPVLRIAPVVENDIIFNAAACWGADAQIDTVPWAGRLKEVPGSGSYNLATGTFRSGSVSALLAELRKLQATPATPSN